MLWYIVTLLVAIILWYLMKYLMLLRQHLKILKTVPLHEEAPAIFDTTLLKKVKNPDEYFKLIHKWIYKTGVQMYALWILIQPWPAYYAVKPQTIKELLHLPVSTNKGTLLDLWRGWLGDGLLLSYGKKWERNRRLLTPAFHFDILKEYAVVFNRTVEIMMDNIHVSTKEGQSVDIEPLVKSATLDTMLRCTLSYGETENIQELGKPHPYLGAVETLTRLFTTRSRNPLLYWNWLYYLTSDGKEFKKTCDFVHDFAYKIIYARREALAKEPSASRKRHPDFLDILLQARDQDGKGLSDLEIRSEVDTFMFAGHDTTGSAISWGINSLAKYPDEQEKVRDEVDRVLGDRSDVEWKDLSQLNYLTCFTKEVLRMYSPAAIVTRKLRSPERVNGIDFPAKTNLEGYIHTIHHDPEIWGDPEVFRPERFLPDNMKDMDPYAFIPFSAGSRNCIGQHFAMNEVKNFLSRIVRRFKLSIDPSREAVPFIEAILKSKDGMYLHFQERDLPSVKT